MVIIYNGNPIESIAQPGFRFRLFFATVFD